MKPRAGSCSQALQRNRTTSNSSDRKYATGLTRRIEFLGLLDESAMLNEFARAEARRAPIVPRNGANGHSASYGDWTRRGRDQNLRRSLSDRDEASGLTYIAGAIDELAADYSATRNRADVRPETWQRSSGNAAERYDVANVATATLSVYESVLSIRPMHSPVFFRDAKVCSNSQRVRDTPGLPEPLMWRLSCGNRTSGSLHPWLLAVRREHAGQWLRPKLAVRRFRQGPLSATGADMNTPRGDAGARWMSSVRLRALHDTINHRKANRR